MKAFFSLSRGKKEREVRVDKKKEKPIIMCLNDITAGLVLRLGGYCECPHTLLIIIARATSTAYLTVLTQ